MGYSSPGTPVTTVGETFLEFEFTLRGSLEICYLRDLGVNRSIIYIILTDVEPPTPGPFSPHLQSARGSSH
jgi:hypothetical protein